MNKVILMGRLTRDPEVRYSTGNNPLAIARYTLAVDRRFKRDGEAEADFISCVSFGKTAEFAEKYYRQGLKIVVSGRIQTGSYTNREGQKVYTTEVVVEEQEFAESKSASQGSGGNTSNNRGNNTTNHSSNNGSNSSSDPYPADGFMNIPDGIDEELPFN
ncbi:MAG: single-stranded DNA-binding protein [Eubacterium sp.]|nr:single-stranded DNA-binding protein [Eubacterium sp.]